MQKLTTTLSFSEEQTMLLETAENFFRERTPVTGVRDLMLSTHGYQPEIWQEMIALGWTGLAIAEEYGGSGLNLAAATCIAEPMGRYLSATPWLSTQLAIQGLMAADESLQSEFLPQIAEGAAATVALTEIDASWDLTAAQLKVERQNGQVLLSGTKTFVLNADVAQIALVSGICDGELCLVVLNADEIAAAQPTRETVIDETRRSFELRCDGLSVDAGRLLVGVHAQQACARIEAAALLLLSAEAAGGIAGVLEVIVEYLNTREAFGRKIGGYQGLKHPTVDILIGLERTRSHVYHAASLLDAGEDASLALRMAKAEASASFAFAGDRAVQFHGGFGFTWDCDAQLYLRRALWSQYMFGDAIYHRKHLSEALL